MPLILFRDIIPEAGMTLKLVDENGDEIPVVVASVNEETVTLDANTPCRQGAYL